MDKENMLKKHFLAEFVVFPTAKPHFYAFYEKTATEKNHIGKKNWTDI